MTGKKYLRCACPGCGNVITYPDYSVGGTSICSKCSKVVLLPAAPASSPLAVGNQPKRQPQAAPQPKRQPQAAAESPIPDAGTKIERAVDAVIAKLITEEQDPSAVQKIVKRIKDILTSGEEIQYVGVQKKPVITISPDAVVLTNKRFIIARPRLTGFKFEDFLWREVHDVHLSEQMFGATISCTIVGGGETQIHSIPKKQARRIYAYAQEVEERMIEERRTRKMEETRAAAGGVVIQVPTQDSSPGASSAEDPFEQLGKLKKMLDAGLIEPAEFESKKAEIVGRM